MELADFAERATAIERESADTAVREGVTDLLSAAGADLPVVARYVQGRVFPAHDSTKLDIGPALCYEAIAKAAGQNVTADDVESRVAEVGDVGEVAASYGFGGQRGLGAFGSGEAADGLTIAEVDEDLRALADSDGAGSQDTKRDILFGLFNRTGGDEARYLARLVLSEMRIGVGEGTVRDAIAEAFDVPVDEVERALQVANDYGEVAAVARDEGRSGLETLGLEIGRPVGAMLAQSGTVTDALDDWGEAAVEWKFDGARCVSGFTPIYEKSRGATAIRDISVGDQVLTHEGRFREVVAKNKRTIESGERVFRFSTYLGEDFKITEGHELLVERPNGPEWIPIESVGESDRVLFPVPNVSIENSYPDRIELRTVGNYVKEFALDRDFFRFLGYWVGDGTSNRHNGNRRLGLLFNNDDESLQSEYREIITRSLGISPDSIHEYDHGGATELYWTDRPLLRWLSDNFRKQDQDGWRNKKVPQWFWNVSESHFEAFFRGWVEADGHVDEKGKTGVVTKERQLASTVQLIALGLGRPMAFHRRRRNGSTYYELSPTKSERHVSVADGYASVRILKRQELSRRSPREVDPRQTVYNLQVEGDRSYCAPLLAMHNCQIHHDGEDTRLFSRNMEDVTDPLPEVVEFVEAALDEPAILDGEVVAIADDGSPLPFQEVLRRFRRKHDVAKAREDVTVEFRAFDCLHAAGDDLLDEPLADRRDRLGAVLGDQGAKAVSTLTRSSDPDEIADVEAAALDAGHEGIMLKNPESAYTPGRRGKNWLKRKPDVETLDLVVTGAEWGEGRRANLLGTFLLSARTDDGFETLGKVATGITDEELAELTERLEPYVLSEDGTDVDIEPAVVFEVGYEEIQSSPTYSSGYALRFPRYLGVREDKDPDDADSLERVERLADGQ